MNVYIYVFLGYLNVDIVFTVLNSVDVSVEDRVLTGASRPTISRAQHLNTDTVNTMVNITLCIKPFCKAAKNLQMRPQVTSRKRGTGRGLYRNTVIFICFYCESMRLKPETLHLSKGWTARTEHVATEVLKPKYGINRAC